MGVRTGVVRCGPSYTELPTDCFAMCQHIFCSVHKQMGTKYVSPTTLKPMPHSRKKPGILQTIPWLIQLIHMNLVLNRALT